jgi:Domain of unknown function (DUF4352)
VKRGAASLTLAIAMAAASLALASCGSSSPSSSPSTTGTVAKPAAPPVGTPIHIPAQDTRLIVTVQRVIFPLRGSGMLLTPGDAAAGVEIAVRNVGNGVYDSSSESDVSLRTPSGEPADPGFAAHGPCTTSEVDFLKTIQPGESRSGCVAFDVPRGERPNEVRFAPDGRRALARAWTVKS